MKDAQLTLRQRLSQGPFTLALSSGFFGFFAHYGLILALRELGLNPARTTGASAGAVLAAAVAYDLSNDELKSVLGELKRESFWDPSPGFGFLKGERMEAMLRELFKNRNPILPFAISTFDIFKRQTQSFSEGDPARLVRASCAVPMMFHPVKINGRHYWDGGILDKEALASVTPDENLLLHFLPGQGVHKLYESNRALENLRKRYLVISNEDLPSVGPFNLKNGIYATELAYEYAMRELR